MRRLGAAVVMGAVLFAAACGESAERTAVRSEGGDTPIAAFVDTSAESEVTTTSVVESGGTTSIVTSPPTTAVAVTTTTVGSTGTTVAAVTTTTVVGVSPQPDTTPTTAAAPVTTTTPTTAAERAEVPALTVKADCSVLETTGITRAVDVVRLDRDLGPHGYQLPRGFHFRDRRGDAVQPAPEHSKDAAQRAWDQCAADRGGAAATVTLVPTSGHPGAAKFAELVKAQLDGLGLKNYGGTTVA